MPIYEYKCDTCGDKFEKLIRRAEEESSLACPACGERRLSQEYSTFAAHASAGNAGAEMPGCAGGMCPTPGMCGRN